MAQGTRMLLAGPDGKLVPQGTISKRDVANFTDNTLPSWLPLSAASSADTGSSFSVNDGRVTLTSANVTGRRAALRTTPIQMGDHSLLKFTVAGITVPSRDNIEVGLGIFGSTIGATFRGDSGYPNSCVWTRRTAAEVAANLTSNASYDWLFATTGEVVDENLRRRTLTFWLSPLYKEVAIAEGGHDEIPRRELWRDLDMDVVGVASAYIYVATKTTAAKSVSFDQVTWERVKI